MSNITEDRADRLIDDALALLQDAVLHEPFDLETNSRPVKFGVVENHSIILFPGILLAVAALERRRIHSTEEASQQKGTIGD